MTNDHNTLVGAETKLTYLIVYVRYVGFCHLSQSGHAVVIRFKTMLWYIIDSWHVLIVSRQVFFFVAMAASKSQAKPAVKCKQGRTSEMTEHDKS